MSNRSWGKPVRFVLNPRDRKRSVLGFEWLEPLSYGYDSEGILRSITGKIPAYTYEADGAVDFINIFGKDFDDFMEFYGLQEFEERAETGETKFFLSASEVCKALSIGRSKLMEMTADGSIPSIKIGQRRLYPLDQLATWARDQKEGG